MIDRPSRPLRRLPLASRRAAPSLVAVAIALLVALQGLGATLVARLGPLHTHRAKPALVVLEDVRRAPARGGHLRARPTPASRGACAAVRASPRASRPVPAARRGGRSRRRPATVPRDGTRAASGAAGGTVDRSWQADVDATHSVVHWMHSPPGAAMHHSRRARTRAVRRRCARR